MLGSHGWIRKKVDEVPCQNLGFFLRLALDGNRHHRSACLGYRATVSFEFNFLQDTIRVFYKIDVEMVSAKRIYATRDCRRLRKLPEILRVAIVVQDHLLI